MRIADTAAMTFAASGILLPYSAALDTIISVVLRRQCSPSVIGRRRNTAGQYMHGNTAVRMDRRSLLMLFLSDAFTPAPTLLLRRRRLMIFLMLQQSGAYCSTNRKWPPPRPIGASPSTARYNGIFRFLRFSAWLLSLHHGRVRALSSDVSIRRNSRLSLGISKHRCTMQCINGLHRRPWPFTFCFLSD